MGPITREVLQQGLLEYLAIMVIFEPGKEERGMAHIEPKDIVTVFDRKEYLQMYKAGAPILARLLESPEERRRELAYAIDRAHLQVWNEYGRQESSR